MLAFADELPDSSIEYMSLYRAKVPSPACLEREGELFA